MSTYHIQLNYTTHPYKHSVMQFRSLQLTACVLFVNFFIKAHVVNALKMGTHNMCFYKENQKKDTQNHRISMA